MGMNRRKFLGTACQAGAALAAARYGFAQSAPRPPANVRVYRDPADRRLITETDMYYLGSFNCPMDNGWENAGFAVAFNPVGNGGAGSLFVQGRHVNGGVQVAEIAIPTPKSSSYITASVMRPMTNLATGSCPTGSTAAEGLCVLNTPNGWKLHWTLRDYYAQVSNPRFGHGYCDLDFTNKRGAWRLEGLGYNMEAGYLFEIPAAWASVHCGGRRLGTGLSSDNGSATTNWGAAMYAIAPWLESIVPPPDQSALPYTKLLEYPYDDSGVVNLTSTVGGFAGYKYPGADRIFGVAWLEDGTGRQGILCVGREGSGGVRYKDPTACETGGQATDPYHFKWWFIDPADIAAVLGGTRAALSVGPYREYTPGAEWPASTNGCHHSQTGITFDRTNRTVYILNQQANVTQAMVHVYRVGPS